MVTGHDLYRGVVLNAISSRVEAGQLVLEAEAVNTGTETASVTRINVLLYGEDGQPRWADAGYVPINIYPGQSSPVRVTLPLAQEIEVIADISAQDTLTNGGGMQGDLALPGAGEGTLPMP